MIECHLSVMIVQKVTMTYDKEIFITRDSVIGYYDLL